VRSAHLGKFEAAKNEDFREKPFLKGGLFTIFQIAIPQSQREACGRGRHRTDTVRHRTVRTKGALSAKTAKLMVFKLVNAAAKTWRRLKGENQLPKVVQGVKFQNGIEVIKMPAHQAA
jgi:hypothetical protein